MRPSWRKSIIAGTATSRTTFAVPHDGWRLAYGYRFESADRTIVISGDMRASDAVVRACDSCDVLVHEVYSREVREGFHGPVVFGNDLDVY